MEAPAGPPSLRVVPPPADDPADTPDDAPARPAPAKRRGRAAVPSWSDVLLTTAPPQERDDD